MSKIHVTLELERLRDLHNGLGQFCSRLLAALQEHNSHQLELHLLTPQNYTASHGLRTTRLAWWHKVLGVQVTGAQIWHIVHQDSAYWPRASALWMRLPWLRRMLGYHHVGIVMTLHDLNFLVNARYGPFRRRLKLNALQRNIARCDAIVCISEYTRDQARAHLRFRKNQSVHVIYNGLCLSEDVAPEPMPQVAQTKPFVCAFGVHPKKQYHKLLPLLASQTDLVWVIAGGGQDRYKTKIKQRAKELACADRVVFTGVVSEGQKLWIYRNSIALWFPSGAEGFGLPILEAWACGKPAFVWQGTSLPEIGGNYAFYWSDWNLEHLQAVWKSGMARWEQEPEFAVGAKKRAQAFTWEHAAKAYTNVYQTLYQLQRV